MQIITLNLPPNANILFCSLSFDKFDEFDTDIASIKLDNYDIDVEWDNNSNEFIVITYKNGFDNIINEEKFKNKLDVVKYIEEHIRELNK